MGGRLGRAGEWVGPGPVQLVANRAWSGVCVSGPTRVVLEGGPGRVRYCGQPAGSSRSALWAGPSPILWVVAYAGPCEWASFSGAGKWVGSGRVVQVSRQGWVGSGVWARLGSMLWVNCWAKLGHVGWDGFGLVGSLSGRVVSCR